MNKLKFSWFLFGLSIVLALVFCLGLFAPDMKENVLFRVAMWLGLISQLLLAFSTLANIRHIKKEGDH